MKPELNDKIEAAKGLIAGSVRDFGPDLALCWTGGKDSTLMLWLAREACREHRLDLPAVVTIDEGDGFPEIEDFMADTARAWGIGVRILRNGDVLGRVRGVGDPIEVAGLDAENRRELAALGVSGGTVPFEPESPAMNHLLKTLPLRRLVVEGGVLAVATAIRRDEHPSRAGETALSPRTDPNHVRVHPVLEFFERDVWDATLGLGIPFCDLYRYGFRSLGARSTTFPASDIPAWDQDLEHTPERAGRGRDKEEAMAQLRSLGYM